MRGPVRSRTSREFSKITLKAPIVIIDNLLYVRLSCSLSNNSTSLFLVDSGAQICLFQQHFVRRHLHPCQLSTVSFSGIHGKPQESFGLLNGLLNLASVDLAQTFHIVSNQLNLQGEGLLGGDFLAKFGAKLDYRQGHMELTIPEVDLGEPGYQNRSNPKVGIVCNVSPREKETTNSSSLSVEINQTISIPARSEFITTVPTSLTENYVCNKTTVLPGVFLGNSIGKVEQGRATVSILNTTSQDVCFDTSKLSSDQNLEDLQNFNIISVDYSKNTISNRIQDLLSNLNIAHCNQEEKSYVEKLIRENHDLFHLPTDALEVTNAISHRIITPPDQGPINIRPYRLPTIHREEIGKQLNKMLDDNIIQPSKSPWNAPLLIVPKKDDSKGQKKWRVVIDFRKLNDITVGDAFPLPNISDILDQLGNSKYFTTLDLASGFHQVALDPQDREKTAFSSNFQHYEFLRMPFGLKGAPSTFQRLMNSVLSGLQGQQCFVYMDDIVVYARNLKDHHLKINLIFDRLRGSNLKLQPDKCNFLRKEIVYLGHVINEKGISPDPSKISAVSTFPVPKTVTQIKSFLGLAGYYRRFIPEFSKIATPMTSLLKKNIKYNWCALCDEGFTHLKTLLTTAPVLIYPDFNEEFFVTTDASDVAIGAVLSQHRNSADLPICYASRTLNATEKRYSTIEKELLAIVYGVTQFRPYLYGRKFTIVTDHKPLMWVMNLKDPSSRLMRWKIKLAEYDYTVTYKQGRLNSNADALSRIPEATSTALVLVTTRSAAKRAETNPLEHNGPTMHSPPDKEPENQRSDIPKFQLIGIRAAELPNSKKEMPLFFFIQTEDQENVLDSPLEIDSCQLEPNVYSFTMFTFLITEEHILRTRHALTKIMEFCKVKKIPKIQLCSDLNCHRSIINLKTAITSIFQELHITVYLLLNHVTNITDATQIPMILKEFHETPIGGHQGVTRTYNRVKLSYQWPSMKASIRDYISTCSKCQANKVSRINKLPMKITSTASKPFELISLDIVGPLPFSQNSNKYILTFQDNLTKYSEAIPLPTADAHTVAEEFVTKIICRHGIPSTVLTDQGSNFLSKLFADVCKLLKSRKIQTTAYHPQTNGQLERSHRTLAEYLRNYIDHDESSWDTWLPYAMFVYNTTPHTSTKYTPHELVYGHIAELPSSLTLPPALNYNYDCYANELKARLRHCHQIAKKHIQQAKETAKRQYDKNAREISFSIGDMVLLRHEARPNKLAELWSGPFPITKIISSENTEIQLSKRKNIVHNNRLKLFQE